MSGFLVSGATTPLGEAVIRELCKRFPKAKILAIGYEPKKAAGVLTVLPGVTYRQVNLVRSRRVRSLLFGQARDLGIETVLHLATHRRASVEGRRVHALNVESTRELLHLCEAHPTIRRFVYRSFAAVYDVAADRADVLAEDHPLNLSPLAPQWIRDRVAADLIVCTQMGMSELEIVTLRCAECVAPGIGSQIYDFLQSRVCMRPLGYDPMLNLLSMEDLSNAIVAATTADQGIYNVPGFDTLPLSSLIARWGRVDLRLPGPVLSPLYRLRRATLGSDFRYGLNRWRFHFSAVLDGRRAANGLGYTPSVPLRWPAGA